ncbi:helix-turn-helix domain-containing protein [Actinomadura formosensis]|uniref:helix-turn-helix domain-containing protein n=3 Tax=Actinomadura formosensis TaxID=60706 RepID=UPI0010410B97|nr:helix-turn-helix domain-containing protein [Actinomadura formosensis]
MNDGEEELAPSSVTTEEQFVVALRRLRERSGLTYKEIERRTSAGDGLPLPASTLATALHRHTVPRREIVTALVQVCGDDVTPWLTARERLLHPMPPEPPAPAESPPQAPPRPRRLPPRRIVAGTAILAVAAIAIGVVLTRPSQNTGSTSQPAPATSSPTPIRPGSTLKLGGLCLSERAYDRTGLVFLKDCDQSFPPRRLTRDGTFWRVTTRHPEFGPGCMGVVDASFRPGTPLSDDTCGHAQPDRFTLRRVTGGVQLRPADRDLCVGVKGAPAADAPILQLPCDEHAPGQLFTIT